jgi:hypothetical protein
MNKLMTEIEKRKMINLIQQGEAKNTKRILVMPEVKEELKRILGEEKGKALADCLLNLATAADRLDWLMPTEQRGAAMQGGSAFAGAVNIDWE